MHLSVVAGGRFQGPDDGRSDSDHARRSADRSHRAILDFEPLLEERMLGIDVIVLE
jgi:hypothetical protein